MNCHRRLAPQQAGRQAVPPRFILTTPAVSAVLCLQDFPAEESVCLLKRARWFEEHLRFVDAGGSSASLIEESRLADQMAWQVRRLLRAAAEGRQAWGWPKPGWLVCWLSGWGCLQSAVQLGHLPPAPLVCW